MGGLIGAGLFVGSGTAILIAGPGVVVSYSLAGLVVVSLLHLLARLRACVPGAPFITDFVYLGLGDRCGQVAAWIYWAFWVLLLTIEALAGANILVPGGGYWAFLVAVGVLVTIGLVCVGASERLAQFEVGFASLKITVLLGFIALTFVYLVEGGSSFNLPAPWAEEPPLHSGFVSLLAAIGPSLFSLAGVEIVHTAAHEPQSRHRIIDRATALIAIRVFGFYVVSIALIVAVTQWETIRPGFSPFATTLEELGHSHARHWLSAVVLVAVITTLNSALAICSSMKPCHVGARGRAGSRISGRAIAVGCSLAVLCVAACWPGRAYAFLVIVASVLLAVVYMLFAVSAGVMIRPLRMSTERSLGYFLLAALSGALLAMAWLPQLRGPLGGGLGLVALMAVLARNIREPTPSSHFFK